MNFKRIVRITTLPLALLLWLAVGQVVYAEEPSQANGTYTVSFSPISVRTNGGSTFIEYTFSEHMLGAFDGTRTGSGSLVIHPDGSLDTENSGIFVGTFAGSSGTVVMRYRGSGTFAHAAGRFNVVHGTGGLAGIHAKGTDSGSATGPTSLAGTYSFEVHFSA